MNNILRTRPTAWMLASVFCFAIFDAITKYLSHVCPIFLLIWARYLIHTIIAITAFLPRYKLEIFKTQRPWAQTGRGLLMLGVSLCMMNGARFLPLAELTALYFTTPLIVTAMTPLLLKETVGRKSWIAVAFGFFGVLIIAKPDGGLTHVASLLPLIAAVLYAAFQISTRNFSKTENPITTNIMTGLVGAILMTVALPFLGAREWNVPDYFDLFLILLLSVSGFLAQLMLIKAFSGSNPADLAPFSYTQLIWASLIGLIVFDAVPGTSTMTGMIVIAASGIFVLGSRARATRPIRSQQGIR